jgi:hypothetical protein
MRHQEAAGQSIDKKREKSENRTAHDKKPEVRNLSLRVRSQLLDRIDAESG